ncbi:MAG: Hpt domain-containing protein [Rubrivivax sp.]
MNEFVGEARGHLEAAEAEILKLEEMPDDLEAVNAVFRSFHTIKGGAGFLNLQQIGSLAHASENLLDLARHGKLKLAGPTVDVVLEVLDLMKLLVDGLKDAVDHSKPIPIQPQLPGVLTRVNQCAGPGDGCCRRCRTGRPRGARSGRCVDCRYRHRCHADRIEAGREVVQREGRRPRQRQAEATVKVSTDRLDSLINMVGELVIAQSMVHQDMQDVASQNTRLVRNMGHLGKLTRELQDLSMSMRMIPINGVFQKMARLVRDLGRKFDKEIDLVVVGGETELDRNVVEAISDPLVHMVRNSIDHGLEPSAERRVMAGKPRAGRVELKAYHHSGNIVIEITDDGRGLNKAKILKKANDAGIVHEGQELSEQEIFKLIFAAGLSTAEKLTDVSGRGVGMDVVREHRSPARPDRHRVGRRHGQHVHDPPAADARRHRRHGRQRRLRALHHPDHQHRAEHPAEAGPALDRAEPRRAVHRPRRPAAALSPAQDLQRRRPHDRPDRIAGRHRAGRSASRLPARRRTARPAAGRDQVARRRHRGPRHLGRRDPR